MYSLLPFTDTATVRDRISLYCQRMPGDPFSKIAEDLAGPLR